MEDSLLGRNAVPDVENYSYTPLPTPTSIRLLRIGERDDAGFLRCSIKIVDLADAPWYYAFSYTWGNPHAISREDHAITKHYNAISPEYAPDAKQAILCDGKVMYINRNLYDAFCDVPRDAWRKFINKRNPDNGWTRLHLCVAKNLVNDTMETARQLLCSGIDLDATDAIGATALYWAARIGKLDMVKLLVEAGAQIDIANKHNKTALDYAREIPHQPVVEYLEKIKAERRLRPSMELIRHGPEVWAWIDQVCINQEDLVERNSQVQIMDQIYFTATFTLIWLGREDSYTQLAISTAARIAPAGERFVNSDIRPYSENSEVVFTRAGMPYISMEEWDSLAALFMRQYFSRLWVVQENALSHILVGYCGGVEIPLEDVFRAAQLVRYRQEKIGLALSAKYVPLNEVSYYIESPIITVIGWKDLWQKGMGSGKDREATENNLIFDTWHLRTTDPRDQIYALFGLVNLHAWMTRDPKANFIKLKADYKKSVEQVYAEATKRLITQRENLSILSAVVDHSIRKISTLPSWIPDYSLPYTAMLCFAYHAAGRLPVPSPLYASSVPWDQLKVRGLQIATVLRTGTTTSGPGDPRGVFDPSWLELTLMIPTKYHHTHQSRTEALWRTLCINKDVHNSTPAPGSYREGFREVITRALVQCSWHIGQSRSGSSDTMLESSLQDAVGTIQRLCPSPDYSDLPDDNLEKEFSDPSHPFFSQDYQSAFFTLFKAHILSITEGPHTSIPTLDHLLEAEEDLVTHGELPLTPILGTNPVLSTTAKFEFVNAYRLRVGRRRLFVTTDRFIGLGLAGTREGDTVWVLPGAGAAFILRKQENDDGDDDRYMFIGEAYLHGAMDGEAADGKEGEMRDIVLV
ncbi:hypothetical protein OIDMADRAFT_171156 [Oidiodendron maius Zn]|uniref:Heterokaryon incompatibility domain-containing protein n=1 Tax=Oidiodendron maius (strain Zn) TaxID=913774 RepID=A0A0C3C9X3_OIDMZ|nr:hypothetical protein OIDMADRAFT_171156 [Oidiodendron maius Zn]